MKISYVDLRLQWKNEKSELMPVITKIFSKGSYVIGKEVDEFEKKIAFKCDVKFAVAFNSGTDALTMGLKLLGIKKGDEVITPPNSFVASTASISHVGATPVFADVLDDQNINPDEIKKR